MNSSEIERIAVLEEKVEEGNRTSVRIENKLDSFILSADRKYVSRDEFAPIKKFTYGLIGAVLLAVLAAILWIVIPASSMAGG